MKTLRVIFNSQYAFWFLLAIPSWDLVADIWWDDLYYAEIMYLSGTWSVIFMIGALAMTPLMKLTGNWWPVFWLLKRRRAIGVASFGYAALHTFFYIRQVGTLELVVLEAFDTVFWLGWLAFILLIVLAITSNQTSVRKLGRHWKTLQRLAYAGLAFSFLHWLWIDQFIPELIDWVAAIVVLQTIRLLFSIHKRKKDSSTNSLQR